MLGIVPAEYCGLSFTEPSVPLVEAEMVQSNIARNNLQFTNDKCEILRRLYRINKLKTVNLGGWCRVSQNG